ncbi:hypothetical protein KR067_004258, partial [Drosophila pandora]
IKWVLFCFLAMGIISSVVLANDVPYLCTEKDDRVCDEYKCVCRR